MDFELVSEIVRLTDEKNYLRNILEASDETGQDAESIILDRIDTIQEKLDVLEA